MIRVLSMVLLAIPVTAVAAEWTNRNPKEMDFTGTKNGFELKVKDAAKLHGQVTREFTGQQPNEEMTFSATICASKPGIGYLMVKLSRDGQEIKRFTSPTNARTNDRLAVTFTTGDSDKIDLLCRLILTPENIGASASFENAEVTHSKPESFEDVDIVPGYQCASVYYKDKRIHTVDFRRVGDLKWERSLPLVADLHSVRGSLLNLQEDTAYEVKAGNDTTRFTTQAATAPVDETIILNETNFHGHLVISAHDKPDRYVRYTAEPGFVLSGKESETILIDGASGILLEGLTVRGGRESAIVVRNAENIRIVNCDIADFGDAGRQRFDVPPSRQGCYYSSKQHKLDCHSGIRVADARNVLIERCYIHDPRGTSNPWFFSHPAGPSAVYVKSAAGLALRFNDFVGGDLHRWNDAVEGWGNLVENGGFRRDGEVCGNLFILGNDDGIELDGGQMNCRVFKNRFEQCLCGISTTPCLLGPSYIYNNLITNLGDVTNVENYGFKNVSGGNGLRYFLDNTIAIANITMSGFGPVSDAKKCYARNNVLCGRFSDAPGKHPVELRHNLYWNGNTEQDRLKALVKKIDREAIIADPEFASPKNGDYRAGVPLGVQDRFYPVRPLDFSVDRDCLTFGGNTLAGTVTVNPERDETFVIRKNREAEFMDITPAEGQFRKGVPFTLHITVMPDKLPHARLYHSVFLIRRPDGLSRPVICSIDCRDDAAKLAVDRQDVIYGTKQEDNAFAFDVTREDGYYVFLKGKERLSSLALEFAGERGTYTTFGRDLPVEHWYTLSPRGTFGHSIRWQLKPGRYLLKTNGKITESAIACSPLDILGSTKK